MFTSHGTFQAARRGPRTSLAAFAIATLALAGSGTAGLTGTASAEPSQDPAAAALQTLTEQPDVAQDVAGQGLEVRDVEVDADGSSHVRIDRTFEGLPVVGGDLVVHQDGATDLEAVSQTLEAPVAVDVQPEVSEASAQDAARQGLAGEVILARGQVTSDLVVDALGETPRLAWEVTTGGRQPSGVPSRVVSYVDAETGEVLHSAEMVMSADGQGRTIYSGDVPLQVTPGAWGSSTLIDPTRGNSRTTNLKGVMGYSWLCWLAGACGDGANISVWGTTFGNGNLNDGNSISAEAAYGMAKTWDYFKNVHGRAGLAGDGKGLIARTHYGVNVDNAYFENGAATFGNGNGSTFKPLVDTDIVAHEFAHGVNAETARLFYDAESGGINEANSDIFGTMVEFYANNPKNPGDYFIGEKSNVASPFGMRRMDDPAQDKVSAGCWSPTTKSLDVHYSSGVGNHFFYLLAEGSGAKTINGVAYNSPTCNGSTVTGIGRDQAAAIWYRALTRYFTTNTDYAAARVATINAAKDLYGATSVQAAAVANAWSAVNVA